MAYAFGRNLLLSSVGFERLIDAFQQLETGDPASRAQTYPPYNIVKHNENDYMIEVAVVPVALGQGRPLFANVETRTTFDHAGSQPIGMGCTVNSYRRTFSAVSRRTGSRS